MGHGPVFRTDLFKGTAIYYDRYRPPYPASLLDDLRTRVPIRGAGRLLDLACGTGQIALALARDFAEVWAVDQEEEFVAFTQQRARKLGLGHVRCVAGRAEDVRLDGPFELVAVGNAFHRLHRQVVAERAMSWLAPGGCLALLWGGTLLRGELAWQRTMAEALDAWMHRAGADDRIPAGWEEAIADDPHKRVLERAGLGFVGHFEFAAELDWTVETLIGLVYSTSFLNRNALGRHLEDFEQDFRGRLLACEPAGVFHETVSFAYDLARRPI